MYEPSLSFAQLSMYNIGRLALTNFTRRAQVSQQFKYAREVLQRLDDSIVATDKKMITKIHGHLHNLSSDAQQFTIGDTGRGIKSALEVLAESILEDHSTLMNAIMEIFKAFGQPMHDVNALNNALGNLHKTLDPKGKPDMRTQLEECRFNLTEPNNMTYYHSSTQERRKRSLLDGFDLFEDPEDPITDKLYDWISGKGSEDNSTVEDPGEVNMDDGDTCDEKLSKLFSTLKNALNGMEDEVLAVESLEENYIQNVEVTHLSSLKDPKMTAMSETCKLTISNITDALIPSLDDLQYLLDNVLTDVTIDDVISRVTMLKQLMDGPLDDRLIGHYAKLLNTSCFWIGEYMNPDKHMNDISQRILSVVNGISRAIVTVDSLIEEVHFALNWLNSSVTPLLEPLNSYLYQLCTKEKMASSITGDAVDDSMLGLRDAINSFTGTGNGLIQSLLSEQMALFEELKKISQLTVPVLTNETILTLKIFATAENLTGVDIRQMLAGASGDLASGIDRILETMFTMMLGKLKFMVYSLSNGYEDLKSSLVAYEKSMEAYLDSVTMNGKFFM